MSNKRDLDRYVIENYHYIPKIHGIQLTINLDVVVLVRTFNDTPTKIQPHGHAQLIILDIVS